LTATVGATGFSLYDYNNSSMMDYYSNMIVAKQSFVANFIFNDIKSEIGVNRY
jgi:hypothetical protein